MSIEALLLEISNVSIGLLASLVRSATAMVKKSHAAGADQGVMTAERLYAWTTRDSGVLWRKNGGALLPASERCLRGQALRLAGEIAYDPDNMLHADLNDMTKG